MPSHVGSLFAGLPAEVASACIAGALEIDAARGATIFRAGDVPRGLLVVLEGRVRVVREGEDGRRQLLHAEGPGGTLGEVPLFAGGTYPATAIAVEPTRLLLLTREALLQVVVAHPELAMRLLERLARRVREVVQRGDALAFEPVVQRLARHLASRLRAGGPSIVSLGMTQAALAEELGTVREVVVRALRSLREAGVLSALGGSRFRVSDAGRLREIAFRRGGLPKMRADK